MRTFKNPAEAYYIAYKEGPRDDTRQAVLSNSEYSLLYSCNVDKCARDDTRKAVLSNPWFAYIYALSIDKGPRSDTRQAVQNSDYFLIEYLQNICKITVIP